MASAPGTTYLWWKWKNWEFRTILSRQMLERGLKVFTGAEGDQHPREEESSLSGELFQRIKELGKFIPQDKACYNDTHIIIWILP